MHPVTYRLGSGSSLLLGAVARVDVISGRPFFFTSFVSADVSIHVTETPRVANAFVSLHIFEESFFFPRRLTQVDRLLEKHAGVLFTPPFSPERVEAFRITFVSF